MSDYERRRCAVAELRAEKGDDGALRFRGYAAVFGEKSENLGGFVEVIAPGAFDEVMAEGPDVRALVEHDPRAGILGRTTSGTLALKVDKRGLRADIEAPDTQAARDTAVSVERGDLDGMSFAFRVAIDGDKWDEGEDGGLVRTVERISDLLDVSIVAYPAYSATEVSKRALEAVAQCAAPVLSRGVPEILRRRFELDRAGER